MSNRMKALGTEHETRIVAWLKEHGWQWAKRKPQTGGKDEGDIWLSERIPFVIEAKTAKATTDRVALGTWVGELMAEVANTGAEAGAVIHKKRGTTDVGEYYAIMPVKYLNELLHKAYPSDAPLRTAKRVVGRRLVEVPIE